MNSSLKWQVVSSFFVGLIFALGLALSGMTQPQKVIGFLDILGGWDPSLAFVMLGAIPVHYISHFLLKGRKSPLFDIQFHLPTRKDINPSLIIGSALFGIGWGIGGFCPGPGLTALGSGTKEALIFVASMTVGMLLYRVYQRLFGGKN